MNTLRLKRFMVRFNRLFKYMGMIQTEIRYVESKLRAKECYEYMPVGTKRW